MSDTTPLSFASPSDRLAAYFAPPHTGQQQLRKSYTDAEIQQISHLLDHHQPAWSRVPRTYIVLRTIGQLQLLNEFIELGFTDHWFPVEARSLPQSLGPSIRSSFVKSQYLVLTKSIDLEKGENGRHGHFGKGDPLPFEIKGKLGSGGFSQVDRILSLISYKEYALKRIRRRVVFGNESREAFKRFKAEVEIVKNLKHRHMVEFVGSYTDPTYLGLIMSPVADTDLAKYMKTISEQASVGRSPVEDLTNLRSFFGCLANALQYLHDQSIRHKDIKPQNILIESGNVLFTDFGLSRNFQDATGSTTSGMTFMTPRYSAPEVAAYDVRNTSADIWSLGCVFLEMTLVLKGLTLEYMKEFFENNGSFEPYVNCNPEATAMLVSKLSTTGYSIDNEPLDWVKSMLIRDRHLRPTAAQVFKSIVDCHVYGGPSTTFYGICCLASGESDSHDSLDEEFVETSRTDSSLPLSSQPTFLENSRNTHPPPVSTNILPVRGQEPPQDRTLSPAMSHQNFSGLGDVGVSTIPGSVGRIPIPEAKPVTVVQQPKTNSAATGPVGSDADTPTPYKTLQAVLPNTLAYREAAKSTASITLPNVEWYSQSPPKPHAFVSLPRGEEVLEPKELEQHKERRKKDFVGSATAAEFEQDNPSKANEKHKWQTKSKKAASAKIDLRSWWRQFKAKKPDPEPRERPQTPTGIFGVPLVQSITYANVAISLFDEDGKGCIYGYIPIITAQCGVFLKEKGTDVESVFQTPGSMLHIKELKRIFETPPRYGKGLDWNGYTIHDAANVFRLYLEELPEPVIPLQAYEDWRDVAIGTFHGKLEAYTSDDSSSKARPLIRRYQVLVTELAPLNRQLLLYLLDILAVFAANSDINQATVAVLASIFQPVILAHPFHDSGRAENDLNKDILEFLIYHQDYFLIGMEGPPAEELHQATQPHEGSSVELPAELPAPPPKTF